MKADAITGKLRAWLDELPDLLAHVDEDTAAFCRHSLRRICDENLLAQKVRGELGNRPWSPVGRVLVVISENDVFGACLALLGACITGNTVRIKARHTRPMLESLAGALGVEGCELLDWDSSQQDDEKVLKDIDAILIAGGDDIIRHYRRVAAAHVRLIEFGPKMSGIVVGRDASPNDREAIDRLVGEVALFRQSVCSSPQFILVDPVHSEWLFAALEGRLASMLALGREEQLAQHIRALELELLARLQGDLRVSIHPTTGWGVTMSSSLALDRNLHRGFTLIAGDVSTLLGELTTKFKRRLQTLGVWGFHDACPGFTRVCEVGLMHARSPLEPHDGVLELPTLVDFVSG